MTNIYDEWKKMPWAPAEGNSRDGDMLKGNKPEEWRYLLSTDLILSHVGIHIFSFKDW